MEALRDQLEVKTDNSVDNPILDKLINNMAEFNKFYNLACKELASKEHKNRAENELNAKIELLEFLAYFQKISEASQQKIISQLLAESNAVFIQALFTYGVRHQKPIQKIIDALPEHEREQAAGLLALAEDDAWFLTSLINQAAVQGQITREGGLLTCAQTAARKISSKSNPYEFNPVILSSQAEFKEFLNLLKQNAPCRERFIISGGHWVAGDIAIDSTGKPSILLMEPLGFQKIVYGGTTEMAIKTCEEVFEYRANTCFDDGIKPLIYVPEMARQRDGKSCMMYALDDLRHLYTIEQDHLPEEFKETGLHAYLKANSFWEKSEERFLEGKEDETNMFYARSCKLPLSFVRTSQFPEAFEQFYQALSSEDKKITVNKSKETLGPRGSYFFATEKGEWNNRIHHALEKTIQFNREFTHLHQTRQEITEAMFPFTLDGLKARYEKKNALAQSASMPALSTETASEVKKQPSEYEVPNSVLGESWQKTLNIACDFDDVDTILKQLENCPLESWLYTDQNHTVSFYNLVSRATRISYRQQYNWDQVLVALLTKFASASENEQTKIATAISNGKHSTLLGVILDDHSKFLPYFASVFSTLSPLDAEKRKEVILTSRVWNRLLGEGSWDQIKHLNQICKDSINFLDNDGNTLLMYCIDEANATDTDYRDDDFSERARYNSFEIMSFYRLCLWALSQDNVDVTVRNQAGKNVFDLLKDRVPSKYHDEYDLYQELCRAYVNKLFPPAPATEVTAYAGSHFSPKNHSEAATVTQNTADDASVTMHCQ